MDDISVLIVEDDKDLVRLIDLLLREIGITKIARASNGRQAIGDLRKNVDKYSLIISDWNMPEVSGLELLQQVRIRRPKLPFLMLTGRSKKSEILAAVKAGVTAYIAKPFTPHELQTKILALCKQPDSEGSDFVEIC